MVGDEAWDLMSDAVHEIAEIYQRELGRLPYSEELLRTFQDVLLPSWSSVVNEGQTTELVRILGKTKKIKTRQVSKVGDVLRAEAANGQWIYARLFEPGNLMGISLGVYDSLGMDPRDLDAIVARPLIVKITPIHPELLEKRAWFVVGHVPISERDSRHPRGPNEVAGVSLQLIAANFHYGLSTKRFYDLESYLVSPAAST